jgi:hypothetical protein
LKTTFRSKSIPKFLCQYSTFITLHFKKRDPTTKLLNKLKIDYDVAKEQYINMTPNEEEFLENLPKAADSYTIQDKMTVLKKILIIQPTNLIKNPKHLS